MATKIVIYAPSSVGMIGGPFSVVAQNEKKVFSSVSGIQTHERACQVASDFGNSFSGEITDLTIKDKASVLCAEAA